MDNLVDNAEFYGVDPEGPSPFENSDNNVVVLVEHECDLELIQQIVLDRLHLLKALLKWEFFVKVKEYIYELISGPWIKCDIIHQKIYSLK